MSTTRIAADYAVGVICALWLELAAVIAMLDQEHSTLSTPPEDNNIYVFGSIGSLNVVIACLPVALYGKASAANVATHMRRTFPAIRYALLLGIAGGIPSDLYDIRLGDVVVSQPSEQSPGVVQWDLGRIEQGDVFNRVGSLDKPATPFLQALSHMKARHALNGDPVQEHLNKAQRAYPDIGFGRPNLEDRLFDHDYEHCNSNNSNCLSCDPSRLISRPIRHGSKPHVHYGNVASGDEVVKYGRIRDRIFSAEHALCIEMEAAGVAAAFPCLVIRGICDYADSHKNSGWQQHAAAVAAAYAKELLCLIDFNHSTPSASLSDVASATLTPIAKLTTAPQASSTATLGGSPCPFLQSHATDSAGHLRCPRRDDKLARDVFDSIRHPMLHHDKPTSEDEGEAEIWKTSPAPPPKANRTWNYDITRKRRDSVAQPEETIIRQCDPLAPVLTLPPVEESLPGATQPIAIRKRAASTPDRRPFKPSRPPSLPPSPLAIASYKSAPGPGKSLHRTRTTLLPPSTRQRLCPTTAPSPLSSPHQPRHLFPPPLSPPPSPRPSSSLAAAAAIAATSPKRAQGCDAATTPPSSIRRPWSTTASRPLLGASHNAWKSIDWHG